ncbi:MAG: hypothetical protein WC516_04935 [Patescibacteria group bacterium]|jgi:hypothetical protein
MEKKIETRRHIYTIYVTRKTSQFNQTKQIMRCKILEAHKTYFLVESLKRYNKKYTGANIAQTGKYIGIPVRRINKDQAKLIIDETTSQWLDWETVCRREGTSKSPGRNRGGK